MKADERVNSQGVTNKHINLTQRWKSIFTARQKSGRVQKLGKHSSRAAGNIVGRKSISAAWRVGDILFTRVQQAAAATISPRPRVYASVARGRVYAPPREESFSRAARAMEKQQQQCVPSAALSSCRVTAGPWLRSRWPPSRRRRRRTRAFHLGFSPRLSLARASAFRGKRGRGGVT